MLQGTERWAVSSTYTTAQVRPIADAMETFIWQNHQAAGGTWNDFEPRVPKGACVACQKGVSSLGAHFGSVAHIKAFRGHLNKYPKKTKVENKWYLHPFLDENHQKDESIQ